MAGVTAAFGAPSMAQLVACAVLLRITLVPCRGSAAKTRTRAACFLVEGPGHSGACRPPSPCAAAPLTPPPPAAVAAVASRVERAPLMDLDVEPSRMAPVAPTVAWSMAAASPAASAASACERGSTSPTALSPPAHGLRAQMVGGARRACHRRRAASPGRAAASAAGARSARRQEGARIARHARAALRPDCAPRSFDPSRLSMKIQAGIQTTSRVHSDSLSDSKTMSSPSSKGAQGVCIYSQMDFSGSKTT